VTVQQVENTRNANVADGPSKSCIEFDQRGLQQPGTRPRQIPDIVTMAATATDLPREYRSATEYRFGDEQAEDIVRTTAYHRKDYVLSVIWFPPREHTNVRTSLATPFQRSADRGLGSLDRMPVELLHDVLVRLDVYSLFKFRQVNIRSRQMVDSLKRYQMIVLHGLNLFCALLRTRIAIHVSLIDLYKALCTKNCALCGEFAGFMSLLTWTRCCFKCLRFAPEIQVQTVSAARKEFYLRRAELSELASLKTLPGIYMDESEHKSSVAIVSVHQTALLCRRRMQSQPVRSERMKKFNFMSSGALPYYDSATGKIEHGISCAGCQLALERYIIGTRGERWAYEARDKVYAQDGFLEHFQWCKQAQVL
jgi:hypothetical protein